MATHKPPQLILLVNPENYDERAFAEKPPKDSTPEDNHPNHWRVLQERGWKPIGDLSAADRKKIADFYKAPGDSPEALEAHLWEAAQPKRREAPPAAAYVPSYQGKPPKKEAKKE